MDFATLMALEPHGPDTFVGTGPRYPWGGLYGGQIVAQALRAAGLTVEPQFDVHSLHAYFIRRGDADEPIRFEVDRVRNGRTFVTRNVIARQAVGAILSLSASFHLDEPAPDVQIATMPDVPGPDEIPSDSWSPMFERHSLPRRRGKAQGWLRMVEPIGDDRALQACALTYMSDDLPTEAVATLHPDAERAESPEVFDQTFWSASLDHAIWFHRPLRAEEPHLHDFTCEGYLGSRGVSIGHILTVDGSHVATVAQEVLFRSREK